MKHLSRREILRFFAISAGAVPVASLLGGCELVDPLIDIAAELEIITPDQKASAKRTNSAWQKNSEKFTSEQEYYVGRTIGAMVFDKYKPYNHVKGNYYLNLLGQTLTLSSDMPETFGGYHFMILDSHEINAFAAPGGLIFVTRGLIKCCRSEDALAAVLAHEIGHVQEKHGLQAVQEARFSNALLVTGAEIVKNTGDADLVKQVNAFEDFISDIASTLINNGYSRSFEEEADEASATILKRAGYDPNGLVDMLNIMKGKLKSGGFDFAKTHPSPADRITAVKEFTGPWSAVVSPQQRQQRFIRNLQGV